MSNWGKAHINNSIGFGQADINTTNDFGRVYRKSNSGDTNLDPTANLLTQDFDIRVNTDLGIFEAEDCLINDLNKTL